MGAWNLNTDMEAVACRRPTAMLSQPMAGKTDEEITATRERAIKAIEDMGYKVVNTLFTDEWYNPDQMDQRGVVNRPLCFMAKGLENMCKCDAVYFCAGWEKARGCRIEHTTALAYGLKILYEEEPTVFVSDPLEPMYEKAKRLVMEYHNTHMDFFDGVPVTMEQVYVVWFCKTLQNWKALVSTALSDGMYYEVTYNGDKHEAYLDAYRKWENVRVPD